jgi:hypothetical protein
MGGYTSAGHTPKTHGFGNMTQKVGGGQYFQSGKASANEYL